MLLRSNITKCWFQKRVTVHPKLSPWSSNEVVLLYKDGRIRKRENPQR